MSNMLLMPWICVSGNSDYQWRRNILGSRFFFYIGTRSASYKTNVFYLGRFGTFIVSNDIWYHETFKTADAAKTKLDELVISMGYKLISEEQYEKCLIIE